MRKIKSTLLIETVCQSTQHQSLEDILDTVPGHQWMTMLLSSIKFRGHSHCCYPKIIHWEQEPREAEGIILTLHEFLNCPTHLLLWWKWWLVVCWGIEILPLYSEFRQEVWYKNCHDYFPVLIFESCSQAGSVFAKFCAWRKIVWLSYKYIDGSSWNCLL